MNFVWTFLAGFAAGGSIIGWVMWNQMTKIKQALATAQQAAAVITSKPTL